MNGEKIGFGAAGCFGGFLGLLEIRRFRYQLLLLRFQIVSRVFEVRDLLFQRGFDGLEIGDVGPQAGNAAVRGPMIDQPDPATIFIL